ncbi:MAG: two-component system, sensor histidine kinase and response regulator [Acidobacteriota bacterium]|jgi:PAS domain S-box-containing protein|nr:two-component system, sensor histidine kinase and response regulator [Acidobacteriota bacterium]
MTQRSPSGNLHVVSPLDPSGAAAPASIYGILDTPHEAMFDELAREAAALAAAPVALLGFLDNDREFVKAAYGWNVLALPGEYSLANRLRDRRSIVVIHDTRSDVRFASHPLVTQSPFVRFYAGVPLIDDRGLLIGALSVVDQEPRTLSDHQVEALTLLARLVVEKLIARRDRLELSARLQESAERFRDFFDRTTDLVMSVDAGGRLLHVNDAVPAALGIAREELLAKPLTAIIDPPLREEFRTALTEIIASAQPQTIETVFVTGGGRRITVEGSMQPKVIDGVAMLARVIFRDISDRKAFEAELGRARDAALESARLKTQFLTNVSHEIRTPMNGIVGMIDLLLATQITEEQSEFAHHARTSAEQLLTIVNNILYISNLEAGSLAAQNVDFDLFRTLGRVVEVMRVAALGKDVDIRLVYDERLPALFRGNQAKLRQVITNLMDNAVKFTEQGSVELRVTQQTETPTHRVVRFDIVDTGIGIADEDRLLLFEKFSQVEAGTTRAFQGVGLGLATARQLIETMGGLIDVESTPGAGSTFWFSMPFAKQGLERPIASSDLEFRGRRVLLIDSYPTSRRIVQHYLDTTWEMRVDLADTSADALQKLRDAVAAGDPFRVVVFDRMPDADPYLFAAEVRRDAAIGDTRLIHLLATNADPDEEHLRAAGVQAYLAKPVGQAELFDAMTIALAHDGIALARPAMPVRAANEAPALLVSAEHRAATRVLLVEDNFLNRKLTMSQLQKLGYPVDTVANGKEAVEAVAAFDYPIILMDCQMPIMDGYEATMSIRKRDGNRHRRIIALTANALQGEREKCYAAGMDDYLSKPTNHAELEIALAKAASPER